MDCTILLDVVVREGSVVFKLLAGMDKSLLFTRYAFLIAYLLFHTLNRVSSLNLKGDGLPRQGLTKDHHGSRFYYIKEGKLY